MSLDIRLNADPVRSIAFGDIGAAYAGIGTSVTKPVRMLILQNLTNASLMTSFDGIDDHLPLIANSCLIMDITANKTIETGFFLAEGQRIYVKQLEVPTSGSVYLSVFYGGQD